MTDWLILAVIVAVFFTVMAAMLRESVSLIFHDPSVDKWCSDTDEDLDALYGE